MDDAAARAAVADKNPFAGMSGEQVFHALERMAESKGDANRFQVTLAKMAPEEASTVRSALIHRMGLANAGAQNADGDAFSIAQFLTRWNRMTPEGKLALFGNAQMRDDMNDLALLAERVKGSERLAGHSNTGAVNSFNATTGGLGGAVIALLSGHPWIAAGLAAPAVYQRVSAEVLTSRRLLNWIARAPKKPNAAAERAHIGKLTLIARAEPAIANDVLQLQQRLASFYSGAAPARVAADEGNNAALDIEPEKAKSDRESEHALP